MTYWNPTGASGFATGGYISAPPAPVTPAMVLAARRGFVQAFTTRGSGWFQGNEPQRAEDFFDAMADEGHWSSEFYRHYAKMDGEDK